MALTRLTKGRARWQTFKLKVAKAVSRSLYDKLLDQGISVKDFGASEISADNLPAFKNALEYCKLMRCNLHIPSGVYTLKGKLEVPEGIVLRGEGAECYGEFVRSLSVSTLKFEGVPANEWCVSLAVGGRPLVLKDINIEGDWSCNGLSLSGNNREVTLDNVSIHKVNKGLYTGNCWVSSFTRFTITALHTGMIWESGATTTKFDRVVIQGDKVGKRVLQIGISFGTEGNAFLHSTKVETSAIQYVNVAVKVAGNASVDLNSMDIEEVHDALFEFQDTGNCNVDISNVYLGATDETVSFFKFRGTIGKNTRIKMGECNSLTRFLEGDWRAVEFIDSNATYEKGAKFIVPQRWMLLGSNHLTNKAPLVQGFLSVDEHKPATNANGLMLTGSTSYNIPASSITNLYDGFVSYDPMTQAIIQPTDVATGISYPYKLCSTHFTVGSLYPEIAFFTLRRAGSDSKLEYKPIIWSDATHHITMSYDHVTDTVTLTTESENQEVFISRA